MFTIVLPIALILTAVQQFLKSTHGNLLAWVSLILAGGLALYGLLYRKNLVPLWGIGFLLSVASMILLFGNSGGNALQIVYGVMFGGIGFVVLLSYVKHRFA